MADPGRSALAAAGRRSFAAPVFRNSFTTADPAANVLLLVLWAIWIGAELAILGRSLFRRGARTRDRGSFFVVFASIFVAIFLGSLLAALLPGAALGRGGAAGFAAGVVVMVAGMALRYTSVVVLGRFFTFMVMVGGDQPVVDRGPYRWIRHPSYTGAMLTVVGYLFAATTNWATLLAVLPMLAALLYRIGVEERALSEELGDTYRAYVRCTKRLIPFIY